MACSLIPSETAGPYPGDGTNGNGINALTQSGIVRADIRSSFGASGSTVAAGTPLTVGLQLSSTTVNCASLAGLAVYIWHCDAQGRYSMYSQGVTGENFLRGVQVSDASGLVTFQTIWPGCYAGRWPHIHFEIYASLAAAVNGQNAIATSQLALPASYNSTVYSQSALYPGSTNNLAAISLHSDNVFGDDDAVHQIATVSGDNASGYVASLEVGVAATPSDTIFKHGFET